MINAVKVGYQCVLIRPGNGMRAKTRRCVNWVSLLLLSIALSVQAIPSLTFQALDLPDITAGQDLWQYTYQFSGFDFAVGQGFTVFFDSHLYADLQHPEPSSSSDWSVIAVQPDTTLQVPGFLDAQALINAPSLATQFQIDFVWLGTGTPGEQPLDIYDIDFSTLTSIMSVSGPGGGGGGTPATERPEPWLSTLLLLVVIGDRALRVGLKCAVRQHEISS